MTDKERLSMIHSRMANGHKVEPADIEWLCDLARSALASQPPAGSVKMRIMVSRYFDNPWYGTAEVFDELTPDPKPEPKSTHAAIVEAWIPPVVVPVVEGRVSNG